MQTETVSVRHMHQDSHSKMRQDAHIEGASERESICNIHTQGHTDRSATVG